MEKITIWINYGTEGWQPQKEMTYEEAIDFRKKGNFFGEIRITIDVEITLKVQQDLIT